MLQPTLQVRCRLALELTFDAFLSIAWKSTPHVWEEVQLRILLVFCTTQRIVRLPERRWSEPEVQLLFANWTGSKIPLTFPMLAWVASWTHVVVQCSTRKHERVEKTEEKQSAKNGFINRKGWEVESTSVHDIYWIQVQRKLKELFDSEVSSFLNAFVAFEPHNFRFRIQTIAHCQKWVTMEWSSGLWCAAWPDTKKQSV